jgi:hypothetical protein
MGGTINWGIFKRHFWENYSGINTWLKSSA